MASQKHIEQRLHNSAIEGIATFDAAIEAACEGMSDADAKAMRRDAAAAVRAVKELPERGSKVILSPVFAATPFEGRTGTVTHHDTVVVEGKSLSLARVAFDGAPVIKTRKHFAMRPGWLVVTEAPVAPAAKPEKPAKDAKAEKKAEKKAEADAPTEAPPTEGEPVAA